MTRNVIHIVIDYTVDYYKRGQQCSNANILQSLARKRLIPLGVSGERSDGVLVQDIIELVSRYDGVHGVGVRLARYRLLAFRYLTSVAFEGD